MVCDDRDQRHSFCADCLESMFFSPARRLPIHTLENTVVPKGSRDVGRHRGKHKDGRRIADRRFQVFGVYTMLRVTTGLWLPRVSFLEISHSTLAVSRGRKPSHTPSSVFPERMRQEGTDRIEYASRHRRAGEGVLNLNGVSSENCFCRFSHWKSGNAAMARILESVRAVTPEAFDVVRRLALRVLPWAAALD